MEWLWNQNGIRDDTHRPRNLGSRGGGADNQWQRLCMRVGAQALQHFYPIDIREVQIEDEYVERQAGWRFLRLRRPLLICRCIHDG